MTILGILFQQTQVVIGAKSGGSAGVLGTLQGVLRQTVGGVAGIVVDVSVQEQHLKTNEVTENPVEDGAKITDHVQIKPAQLTIEGVISDTPLGYAVIENIQGLVRSAENLFGGYSRAINAYNDLVALMDSRQPFTVTTSLKSYDNMVFTELEVTRTKDTGRSIHFRGVMKQIRIVSSKTTTGSPAASVSDTASPTIDAGQQVTAPIPAEDPLGDGSSAVSGPSQGSILQRGFGTNPKPPPAVPNLGFQST